MTYRHDAGWAAAKGELRQKYIYHLQPFYRECRAFGRLKEVEREHLAVKAYGYAILDPKAKDFAKQMRDTIWRQDTSGVVWDDHNDPLGDQFLQAPRERIWEPRMCIIKDWIDDPWSPGVKKHNPVALMKNELTYFPRILEDITDFHECGIILGDTQLSNYIDGVLVDLGGTTTVPHIDDPEHGIQPSWTMASLAANDFYNFHTNVVGEFNETVEGRIARQKEAPPRCLIEAYTPFVDGAEVADRTFGQRPLLPLVDGARREEMFLEMSTYPRYDPGNFDWRNPESIIAKDKPWKFARGTSASAEGASNNEPAVELAGVTSHINEDTFSQVAPKREAEMETHANGSKRCRSASPVREERNKNTTPRTGSLSPEQTRLTKLRNGPHSTAASVRSRRSNAKY
jgi:hypothetical protein